MYYWNLWWVKRALIEQHVSPFFTTDLYFPYGASLYFHTLNLLPDILGLPVAIVLGTPAAYNFLVFLAFTLSGYGTYRLTFHVLRREVDPDGVARKSQSAPLAAFVAGVAFTFSSYHYVHLLGHLDLVSMQWLPFFVLFLLKTRDELGWRSPAICAFFLAATSLTASYYMVFLLVFSALFIVHVVLTRQHDWVPALWRIGLMLAVFALMVSPVLIPMLILGQSAGRVPNPAYDIDRFSTDLLAFVIPSPLPPVWRQVVGPLNRLIIRPESNVEVVSFLGYVPLVLAIVGVKRCRSTRAFWLVGVLWFCALALGPVVHVAGRPIASALSVFMPYRLISYLPYGDIPRVPVRFVVMAMLCLSVIAGCGAWTILKDRKRPSGFATLLAALIVLENAVVPLPLDIVEVPPFYNLLARDKRRAGVIEVPIPDDPAVYPRRMLYQTIHGKPVYGGYLARGLPPLAFDAVPGFGQFKRLSGAIDDVVPYDEAQLPDVSRAVLDVYTAGYVAIEKDLMDSEAIERARQIAESLFGRSAQVYEDRFTLAYAVPHPVGPSPTAVWLDTGWSYLERLSDRDAAGRTLRWHWMAERARFGIVSSEPANVRLKITAQAFGKARRLTLSLDGSEVTTLVITTDRADYETPEFRVAAGASFVELKSLDGAESPGLDGRRLSAAVFRLEILKDN